MKNDPLIGILLATYNGGKYLKAQIDSILQQTYSNWVLLIHDDGSNDDTVSIIHEYNNKYEDKITYIDDNKQFKNAKMNFDHLFQYAKKYYNFDYIMFADQDDVWLSTKIEKTLKKMKNFDKNNKNIPICLYTDLIVVDKNLNIIEKSFWKYQKINPMHNSLNRIIVQNVVTGCTIMLNQKAIEIINNIPKQAIVHDWWIALVISAFGKLIPLHETTLLYRQHGLNDVGAKRWDFYNAIMRIFSKDELLQFKKNFINSTIQAKAFLNEYGHFMNRNQISLVEHYVNLISYNRAYRLYYVFKFGYFKSNLFRNLGSIIFRLLAV